MRKETEAKRCKKIFLKISARNLRQHIEMEIIFAPHLLMAEYGSRFTCVYDIQGK